MIRILCVMLTSVIIMSLPAASGGQSITDDHMIDYLKETLEYFLGQQDGLLDGWKSRYTDIPAESPNLELLAYSPPDFPVQMADIASFLYQETGKPKYAEITRNLLVSMEKYQEYFPEKFRQRAEYAQGIPVIHWFRALPVYVETFQRTRDSEVYSTADRKTIEQSVAVSADFIFTFPEWSAMNRAMLRAESFMAAALSFPSHPHADDWRKMAEILADDSLGKWEIEDAQIYHAVWLKAYIHYLDLTGQDRVFRSPMMQYYFRYFVSL
ncbi:MAG TPA: hypothetical protein VKA68_18665, partial [bacterium]|nr:hypothetical protein [bacterium]